MDLESAITAIIDRRIAELGLDGNGHADPVMITLDEAAKDFFSGKVSRDTLLDLHHRQKETGFPSVQMSPRVILIDKRRLGQWTASGGLELKA